MEADDLRVLFFLIVYWNLKPLFFMAKFELKFLDKTEDGSYIKVDSEPRDNVIFISGKDFSSQDEELNECIANFSIWLDKSTAIKLAKTLRTEINKITESEVGNG